MTGNPNSVLLDEYEDAEEEPQKDEAESTESGWNFYESMEMQEDNTSSIQSASSSNKTATFADAPQVYPLDPNQPNQARTSKASEHDDLPRKVSKGRAKNGSISITASNSPHGFPSFGRGGGLGAIPNAITGGNNQVNLHKQSQWMGKVFSQ
jgi:hypothetical protein